MASIQRGFPDDDVTNATFRVKNGNLAVNFTNYYALILPKEGKGYFMIRNKRVKKCFGSKKKEIFVKCGVRTHAHFRVPELKSGALDRSANLTSLL